MPDGKKEGRNKADDKAAMAAKRDNKAMELAMGITKDVKRSMAGDVVLCMECKATQLGPIKCECVGGRRPPTGAYDPLADLAAAAKARASSVTAAQRAAQSAAQDSVAAEKAKRRAGTLDLGELAAEGLLQGDSDGVSMQSMATFSLAGGKLGMGLERNAVCKVTDGTQATEQGVAVGWVLRTIGGESVGADKAAIMKRAASSLKASPDGVRFGFQCAIDAAAAQHCGACDKFVPIGDFDAAQLEAGPGKQLCASCEEYAAEYGDDFGADMD